MYRCLSLLLLLSVVSTAHAHFVWIQLLPGAENKPATAQVVFGETPAPGKLT